MPVINGTSFISAGRRANSSVWSSWSLLTYAGDIRAQYLAGYITYYCQNTTSQPRAWRIRRQHCLQLGRRSSSSVRCWSYSHIVWCWVQQRSTNNAMHFERATADSGSLTLACLLGQSSLLVYINP